MAKFRKKPVVIEAIQWSGNNCDEAKSFCNQIHEAISHESIEKALYIRTEEGIMKASINDWIIKGVNGEFYPCKPDIFEKTYEPA